MSDDNWYILHVEDGIDRKIIGLSELGVPCHNVSKIYKRNHISFPAANAPLVMDYFGKKDSPYTLEPTSMANMFLMRFFKTDMSYLTPPGPNFECWDGMTPVMKSIYDIFGVKIIPSNPHGEPRTPVSVGSDSGFLYVHFYSSPIKTSKVKMTNVYGYELSGGQCDAMKPSNTGIAIKDDSGTVVAEYLNENLYVLFDLPHGDENVTEIFARIMTSYFAMRGVSTVKLREFYQFILKGVSYVTEPFKSKDNSSRAQFARECGKLYKKNLKAMEDSLNAYNAVISENNRKLIETMRERDIILLKLEPLRSSVDARQAWADTEYDNLLATPHVENVKVEDKVISIYTDMITIHYVIKDYNIGKFRIDIHTDGSDLGVTAFNLTSPKNGCAHPHIKQEKGYCCLGNIQNGITKLLAEYQYVIVAQIMINFLHSYNEDSAYNKIYQWG